MPRADLPRDLSRPAHWARGVALGSLLTAGVAAFIGGIAGLLVAIGAVGVTLSGELLGLVQTRSRRVRDELLQRLADVQAERTDETVDARSHDPFGHVGRMLHDFEPATPSVVRSLAQLEETLAQVDVRLARTSTQREGWTIASPPELIGGLAGVSDTGAGLRRYGDPVNLPGWLPGRRPRRALLQIGRVLDDIRLLHSRDIEWAVLTFTLWARALLLALAPTLGALSFAPLPDLGDGAARLAAWVVALAWALVAALAAPRIATLAMDDSAAGLRARRVLLAIELPMAVTLTLLWPGWPVVAFAAGWTNWWQRIGRTTAIPDFSWSRLVIWIAVTAGAQATGLALAAGGIVWWHLALEIAITMGVVAVIGGSYGAMLPVTVGVTARILFTGASHRRRADSEAQRLIDDIAEAMTRAADELASVAARRPADAEAEAVLRRAVHAMLPAAIARRRSGPQTVGAVVTSALADAGHDMWIEDPRALATQARAEEAGQPAPVVVVRPDYAAEGVANLMLGEDVAATLHRLIVACVVEARVHGTRRVQTIVGRRDATVEVRIANPLKPAGVRTGRGRGGREIRRLAASLPDAGELVRGPTDRSFVGGRPVGELFGVRFTFTVRDTAAGAGATRTRV